MLNEYERSSSVGGFYETSYIGCCPCCGNVLFENERLFVENGKAIGCDSCIKEHYLDCYYDWLKMQPRVTVYDYYKNKSYEKQYLS